MQGVLFPFASMFATIRRPSTSSRVALDHDRPLDADSPPGRLQHEIDRSFAGDDVGRCAAGQAPRSTEFKRLWLHPLAYGDARWGVFDAAARRPRRSEIPIAAIQTKKPTKPMNVMPSMTSEAGANAPSQPAKNATMKPSQPIQRPTTRVFNAAYAYIGTTTPQRRMSPA